MAVQSSSGQLAAARSSLIFPSARGRRTMEVWIRQVDLLQFWRNASTARAPRSGYLQTWVPGGLNRMQRGPLLVCRISDKWTGRSSCPMSIWFWSLSAWKLCLLPNFECLEYAELSVILLLSRLLPTTPGLGDSEQGSGCPSLVDIRHHCGVYSQMNMFQRRMLRLLRLQKGSQSQCCRS